MSGAIAVLMSGAKPLTVTVSSPTASGFKSGSGTVTTSGSITVTASGGQTPFTYLWTFVSGDAAIGPINGTSPSTKFSAYFATAPGYYTAVYKCVATDAVATVVDSPNVSVTLICEP